MWSMVKVQMKIFGADGKKYVTGSGSVNTKSTVRDIKNGILKELGFPNPEDYILQIAPDENVGIGNMIENNSLYCVELRKKS